MGKEAPELQMKLWGVWPSLVGGVVGNNGKMEVEFLPL